MTNMLSRNLALLAFACFQVTAASADFEWGIRVTGESDTACELKKPFRISASHEGSSDIWVGFYWLRNESVVPGYTLPANEVIFIVKTQQDFDDLAEAFEEPDAAYIDEIPLKKYMFEAHVGGHAFFFADGELAQSIFDAVNMAAPIDIRFEFEDEKSQVLQIRSRKDERFEIYAAMFSACGEAITK